MVDPPGFVRPSALGEEPVSRETLLAHQRERVLALATAAFAKRGYQGITVNDLLASSKVGVGNFYSLFEGKEDCFLAAFERIVTRERSEVTAATGVYEDWAERAYVGLAHLIGAVLERPLDARLVLIEAQSAGPEALSRYNGLLDATIVWLRKGRSYHEPARSLPQGFEQAAISGLAFYLQRCLLDARRHRGKKLLAEAGELVLEPIVGVSEMDRLSGMAVALRS